MIQPPRARLLVVDDDAEVVDFLADALGDEGYAVTGLVSARAALDEISSAAFDLVVSDVEMPDMRGPDLMAEIHRQRPDQLVLMITAFGSIEMATESIRAGACDFLAKPFTIEALLHAVDRALRERQLRREIVRLRRQALQADAGQLVASSDGMRRVIELAGRVARTTSTVLLTGESGVGKGAVAELIHRSSGRSRLVQINCAALPAALVEAELFGVRRGAYTDAREDRDGLFVQARGGTLLLDEIGELSLETQAKLLTALERRRVRPVGGDRELDVDVRLLAATNKPLEAEVRAGRFRADLFHRLNVLRIPIPPLRERREDIPALIDRLLPELCERIHGKTIGVSAAALRWLVTYDWPGNVRELGHVLERAVTLAEHDVLVLEDVMTEAVDAPGDADSLIAAARRGATLAAVEDAYIRCVLDHLDGNKAHAARLLGIDRRTLYRRLGTDEGES